MQPCPPDPSIPRAKRRHPLSSPPPCLHGKNLERTWTPVRPTRRYRFNSIKAHEWLGSPSLSSLCPLSSFPSTYTTTPIPTSPTLRFPLLLHSPGMRIKKKLNPGETDQIWLEFPQVRAHHFPLINKREGDGGRKGTHKLLGSWLHLNTLVFWGSLFLPAPLPPTSHLASRNEEWGRPR